MDMQYRKLPHGEEKLSIIGLGTSSIGMAGDKEIEATVELALENGVNFFDMASADAAPFPAYGRAMAGARDKVYFQIHFGADYHSGKYGWTTDLDTIKRSIDWQLSALRTDTIDFGFLHCLDEEADLHHVLQSGVLDYIRQLQQEGVVRHIGMSSHTPRVVNRVLDMGVLDLLMFSINPGYDYHHGEFAIGGADERMALYQYLPDPAFRSGLYLQKNWISDLHRMDRHQSLRCSNINTCIRRITHRCPCWLRVASTWDYRRDRDVPPSGY